MTSFSKQADHSQVVHEKFTASSHNNTEEWSKK